MFQCDLRRGRERRWGVKTLFVTALTGRPDDIFAQVRDKIQFSIILFENFFFFNIHIDSTLLHIFGL